MASDLAQKLRIEPGDRVLAFNAPDDYANLIAPLPQDAELQEDPAEAAYDVVHLFAANSGELEQHWPDARGSVKPGGIIWVSYPKRASGVETDITRDRGWDPVLEDQWRPVSQISVDETWSALRFRPVKPGERGSQAWQPR
jgi:hypothetical protein